jgi:hypothetical protein
MRRVPDLTSASDLAASPSCSTQRTKRIAGIAVGASVFAIILGCASLIACPACIEFYGKSSSADLLPPLREPPCSAIVFWIWRTERNGRRKLAAYVSLPCHENTFPRQADHYAGAARQMTMLTKDFATPLLPAGPDLPP